MALTTRKTINLNGQSTDSNGKQLAQFNASVYLDTKNINISVNYSADTDSEQVDADLADFKKMVDEVVK